MKTIRTLVISPNAPDTNSVWLYKGTMKYFNNGQWETIGADPDPYILPVATTTVLGGVKKGAAVVNVAADADAAALVTSVNALLASLRAAGIINS